MLELLSGKCLKLFFSKYVTSPCALTLVFHNFLLHQTVLSGTTPHVACWGDVDENVLRKARSALRRSGSFLLDHLGLPVVNKDLKCIGVMSKKDRTKAVKGVRLPPFLCVSHTQKLYFFVLFDTALIMVWLFSLCIASIHGRWGYDLSPHHFICRQNSERWEKPSMVIMSVWLL